MKIAFAIDNSTSLSRVAGPWWVAAGGQARINASEVAPAEK